jgi:hypothetical protein
MKDAEALFGHPATQKQGPTTPRHGECDWDYDAPDNSSHCSSSISGPKTFTSKGVSS